jgi:hypothetical protein
MLGYSRPLPPGGKDYGLFSTFASGKERLRAILDHSLREGKTTDYSRPLLPGRGDYGLFSTTLSGREMTKPTLDYCVRKGDERLLSATISQGAAIWLTPGIKGQAFPLKMKVPVRLPGSVMVALKPLPRRR